MKFLLGIIFTIVILCLGAWVVIYTGYYNVGADSPDYAIMDWALSHTSDHSVEWHARGIQVPSLNDPSMIEDGASHYKEHCEICHGGPGVTPDAIGKGLNPEPPDLAKSAKELSAAETFWIVKHGIKMTGMPSFGKEYDDKDLWAIVAFVKHLPAISPDQFAAMGNEKEHGP